MTDTGAIDLVRPFAWLAAIAFLVGFFAYLAVGYPTPAQAQDDDMARASAASGPSSKDWNLPKQI
jgi:hypothetical protein